MPHSMQSSKHLPLRGLVLTRAQIPYVPRMRAASNKQPYPVPLAKPMRTVTQ
ncbi:hypothetical protein B0T17DRAFT_525029 [Bombardia bombarda]|uniref:Uncharacterized protein n=1 Tax=Bombardia bombarda TaxID=252184 RepID=A0AA40C8T8_9PEZI|nr:hypothetical protein B0T17DRAFT_525029 [Bombardia bombarda]